MRIMYLADLTAPWINTLLQYYFWAKSVIKIKENKKSRKKREEPHYWFTTFPSIKTIVDHSFHPILAPKQFIRI